MTPQCCPLCPSDSYRRKGFDYKGRQRYSCKACLVEWTEETWEKQHTKGARILHAMRLVDEGFSIKDAAAATGFSAMTVRKYHKLHRGKEAPRRAG